jgi:hypothetical protein
MAIELNGTTGITTPDVNSDGLTVDTTTLVVDEANNRVGIGTSSPATSLHIKQTTDALPALQLQHGDGDFILCEENGGTDLFKFSRAAGTNDLAINVVNSASVTFYTNNTERARIDSSGNLLVGTTSTITSGTNGTQIGADTITTGRNSTNYASHHAFWNPNGNVGAILTYNSGTLYNTSSDYRLKEDFQPIANPSERVKALKPINFAWKVDGLRVDGFLAHEAAEVVPEAVSGEKDAVDDEGNPVYQGIDQSKLVPLLTAALQEALGKIETLEARVAALEAA